MLNNDTLKNGTSSIGLYGSASPGIIRKYGKINACHPDQ